MLCSCFLLAASELKLSALHHGGDRCGRAPSWGAGRRVPQAGASMRKTWTPGISKGRPPPPRWLSAPGPTGRGSRRRLCQPSWAGGGADLALAPCSSAGAAVASGRRCLGGPVGARSTLNRAHLWEWAALGCGQVWGGPSSEIRELLSPLPFVLPRCPGCALRLRGKDGQHGPPQGAVGAGASGGRPSASDGSPLSLFQILQQPGLATSALCSQDTCVGTQPSQVGVRRQSLLR